MVPTTKSSDKPLLNTLNLTASTEEVLFYKWGQTRTEIKNQTLSGI